MDERGTAEPGRAARRGEAARDALIEAGIELFGRHGLEGASTRAIARAARQNVAAIAYHFGSKDGLYQAVTQRLLDAIVAGALPLIERTEALLADERAKPAILLAALRELCAGLLRMFAREDTRAIGRAIACEQTDPSAAFELIYVRAVARAHACLAGLLVRYAGTSPGSVDSVLHAHILLGSILGFCVAAATVLRGTGWQQFGPSERQRVERLVCEHAEMYARALRAQARRGRVRIAQPRHSKAATR